MGILGRRLDKKETQPIAVKKTASVSERTKAEATRLVRRPWVSEKASRLASSGTYVFEVAKHATRIEVGKAIFALYGVRPTSVRIQRVRSKAVRFGRITGTTSERKKALVTLPSGSTIDVYQGV
jgi:large subunit ribosomal protein L23